MKKILFLLLISTKLAAQNLPIHYGTLIIAGINKDTAFLAADSKEITIHEGLLSSKYTCKISNVGKTWFAIAGLTRLGDKFDAHKLFSKDLTDHMEEADLSTYLNAVQPILAKELPGVFAQESGEVSFKLLTKGSVLKLLAVAFNHSVPTIIFYNFKNVGTIKQFSISAEAQTFTADGAAISAGETDEIFKYSASHKQDMIDSLGRNFNFINKIFKLTIDKEIESKRNFVGPPVSIVQVFKNGRYKWVQNECGF